MPNFRLHLKNPNPTYGCVEIEAKNKDEAKEKIYKFISGKNIAGVKHRVGGSPDFIAYGISSFGTVDFTGETDDSKIKIIKVEEIQ